MEAIVFRHMVQPLELAVYIYAYRMVEAVFL